VHAPLWYLAAALVACGEEPEATGPIGTAGDSAAAVDSAPPACQPDHDHCDWEQCSDAEPGEEMLPGADCLACHNAEVMTGQAPPPHGDSPFFLAGTVYDTALGGAGRADVIVKIYDVQGIAVELTTNASGNFYSSQPLAPPYTAEIWAGKEVLVMETAVETGACNSCHRCDGEAGGKLYAPAQPG